MAHKRDNRVFLFFGTTGTRKKDALERLQKWAIAYGQPQPVCIDFEDQIARLNYDSTTLYQYLDQPKPWHQRTDWKNTFAELFKRVQQERRDKDIYIAMHGALLRRDYGVRSSVAFESLALLEPDAIITLIDDVFVNWWETERRAQGGQEQKGRPTLTQLLIGRRHEILIGDLVVSFLEDRLGLPRRSHYVLALRHSVETLGRLLYNCGCKKAYVSFPISTPRRRAKEGDDSTIKTVNSMLQEVLQFQANHKDIVLFLPVTMDEMLLMDLADEIRTKSLDTAELPLSRRWPIPQVLSPTLRNEERLPDKITMPAKQVEAIAGLIEDEIRTHDFRMIDQSDKVLVLSQYCDKRKSSGVSAEIDYAVTTLRRVEAYQVPDWLPDGVEWKSPSGTGPFAEGMVRAKYVGYHGQLRDALEALVSA